MIALMYHDLVDPGAEDASGFPGKDAATYKVTPAQFAAHVAAIAQSRPQSAAALCFTFDDGGASAMRAADVLERSGLRGCFFVTADYIGTPGFVTSREIRELHLRGHVVGSHSCSHPLRMAHCQPERLREEWTRSAGIISAAAGERISVASVPGGDFAPAVAEAAANAGYGELFTSQPTTRSRPLCGLTVHGRFTIRRGTSAATAARLATGRWAPCALHAVAWSVKSAGKRLGGEQYLRLRRWALGQRDEIVQWGDSRC